MVFRLILNIFGKSYTLKNNKVVSPTNKTTINNLGLKRGTNIGNLEIIFNISFPEDYSTEIKKKLEDIL